MVTVVVGPCEREPTDQDREMVRLYKQGLAARDVAERVGLSHGTVYRRLRECGVRVRRRGHRRRRGCVSTRGYAVWGKSYVHRIVCEAWHGPPPTPDHRVNHIDGDKLNNHPENLEWVTQRENRKHAFENGLLGNTLSAREVCAIRFLRARNVACRAIGAALGGYPSGNVSRVARRLYFDYVDDTEVYASACGWCGAPASELDKALAEAGAPTSHGMCPECEKWLDAQEPKEAA